MSSVCSPFLLRRRFVVGLAHILRQRNVTGIIGRGSHHYPSINRYGFVLPIRSIQTQSQPIEKVYTKLSNREHILRRPGMYIGSTDDVTHSECWLYDLNNNCMQMKNDFSYSPGFLKVVDEILVNACDQKFRGAGTTKIDVTFNDSEIVIENNGEGIPVQIHKHAGEYLPQMLFGSLYTGSNFHDDDEQKQIVGGRHGYGAKLTNLFSHEFTLETVFAGLYFRQTWRDNMGEFCYDDKDTVSDFTGEDFTRITFKPDLARLCPNNNGSSKFSKESKEAILKRCVDVAGTADIEVCVNGTQLSIQGWNDYCTLYSEGQKVYHFQADRWWISIIGKPGKTIAFVNNCSTPQGTHVTYVRNQIVSKIISSLETQHSDIAGVLTSNIIISRITLLVNCFIENPSFDSQSKDVLRTPSSSFGSSCEISDDFIKEVLNDGDLSEELLRFARERKRAKFRNKKKPKIITEKLEDAKLAGKPRSRCTLILTEGDSAKAIAVTGLSILGRSNFGVYPLKGKFINTRNVSLNKLQSNKELRELLSIINLNFDVDYSNPDNYEKLRYKNILIMTDMDADGSHIKGLIINFIHYFWPSLLTRDFISVFRTPLLKARHGDEMHTFYTLQEYKKWRDNTSNSSDYNVKYYKGLGTNTNTEALEYFSAFEKHRQHFIFDPKNDDESINLAFDKDCAHLRREWILENYDPKNVLVTSKDGTVSYSHFIDNELIHFSHADNLRSIPNAIDGLKPSMRKILYGSLKRDIHKEVKVAQLSGFISEHTLYHHGEASLQSAIIKMAQDYVGSNNINLLEPIGQFGSRLLGGKDHASPRYIFTKLSPIARLIFPKEDDKIIKYLEEDGFTVEPECYYPIIPFLLVNGGQGIGSGWSTSFPSYNPMDIIEHVLTKLDHHDGDESVKLPLIRPWVKGFKGEISVLEDGRGFKTSGLFERTGKYTFVISELPVGKWTTDYKRTLMKKMDSGQITNFEEDHTTDEVSFKLRVTSEYLKRTEKIGFLRAFDLENILPTTNMHAFDSKGTIKKYSSAEEIVKEYFPLRLDLYNRRKLMLMNSLKYFSELLQNKSRFISAVSKNEINFISGSKSQNEIVDILKKFGYKTKSDLNLIKNAHHQKSDPSESNMDNFDYLLSIPLDSFSSEKVFNLNQRVKSAKYDLEQLELKKATDLWREDLAILKSELLKSFHVTTE